jgi:hypothetical protein
MMKTEAHRIRFELKKYIECDISLEKCDSISGEHDWMQFRLPARYHAIALAFIAGWDKGGRDALDAHYGRPTERENIEAFKRNNPELA